MSDGASEFDMAHSLTTDFGFSDFDAALFADDAFVADSLISSAVAFPVTRRPEYSLAEKTVFFGFLRTIVYGFRLGDLTIRPFSDLFG